MKKEDYHEGGEYINGFLTYNTKPPKLFNKYAYNNGSSFCSHNRGGWYHHGNVLGVNNQQVATYGVHGGKPFLIIKRISGGSAKRKVASIQFFASQKSISNFILPDAFIPKNIPFLGKNVKSIIKWAEERIMAWMKSGEYGWKSNRNILIEALENLINFHDGGFEDIVGNTFKIEEMKETLSKLKHPTWYKSGRKIANAI